MAASSVMLPRVRRALVIGTMSLLVGGCANGAPAADEAYLQVVRPLLASGTDEQWLDLRDSVCDVLAAKPTREQWLTELKVLTDIVGLNAHNAGAVIGASTASACPQFSSLAPGS